MSERQPLQILLKSINNVVQVKLKDGKTFQGRLTHCDSYMNLCLTSAEELDGEQPIAKFGEVFIRGNNILFIKPDAGALDFLEYESKEKPKDIKAKK
ncbi:MAG: LSM domain-containing protein [Candidatus Jordarchaeum sp.]|uniref:LSM domain-containing protein n=1 Tax=Candidatus Jordarchaeum sp. TaxID=2823881 RepID=UPI00404A24DF